MLWREPFNHTLEEIADLTDEQIDFLCRKDPTAPVKQDDEGGEVSGGYPRLTKEVYVATWKACGRTEEWIEAEWLKEYGDQLEASTDVETEF